MARPTKYNKDMLEKIVPFMSDGASIEEMAFKLGINKDTLNEWCKEDGLYYIEAFSVAIKSGKEASHNWWLRKGREGVTNKEIQASMWYMNMKNRFGWRDKQDVTTDGEKIQGVLVLPEEQIPNE